MRLRFAMSVIRTAASSTSGGCTARRGHVIAEVRDRFEQLRFHFRLSAWWESVKQLSGTGRRARLPHTSGSRQRSCRPDARTVSRTAARNRQTAPACRDSQASLSRIAPAQRRVILGLTSTPCYPVISRIELENPCVPGRVISRIRRRARRQRPPFLHTTTHDRCCRTERALPQPSDGSASRCSCSSRLGTRVARVLIVTSAGASDQLPISPNVVMLSYARGAVRPRVRRRDGEIAADAAPVIGNANAAASAVITGFLDDANEMPPTAASSTGSLMVRVAGTNVCSAVDGRGRFTLRGVPSGTVRLQITGGDVNATVTIPGVETQDQIQIAVRMTTLRPAAGNR